MAASRSPREPCPSGSLGKAWLLRQHAALYQARRALEERGLVRADAFAAYDALGVTPLRVDRDRAAHARAVQRLADALAVALAPAPIVELERPLAGLRPPPRQRGDAR